MSNMNTIYKFTFIFIYKFTSKLLARLGHCRIFLRLQQPLEIPLLGHRKLSSLLNIIRRNTIIRQAATQFDSVRARFEGAQNVFGAHVNFATEVFLLSGP